MVAVGAESRRKVRSFLIRTEMVRLLVGLEARAGVPSLLYQIQIFNIHPIVLQAEFPDFVVHCHVIIQHLIIGRI